MSRCVGTAGRCGRSACGVCYPIRTNKPDVVTTKPPAVLAAERAATDASTRASRLRAACEALEKCGDTALATRISEAMADLSVPRRVATVREWEDLLMDAKYNVTADRRSLLDGRDPARLVACNTALRALAALWEVS